MISYIEINIGSCFILEHEMVVETQSIIEHEEEVETEIIGNMDEEMQHTQIIGEDTPMEPKHKQNSLPPLRPLTIAPKPAKTPLTFKSASPQQLFLLQGRWFRVVIMMLSN